MEVSTWGSLWDREKGGGGGGGGGGITSSVGVILFETSSPLALVDGRLDGGNSGDDIKELIGGVEEPTEVNGGSLFEDISSWNSSESWGDSDEIFTSLAPILSDNNSEECTVAGIVKLVEVESTTGLVMVSNTSSKLSAVLDVLFSSSESTGEEYELVLFCNLDNSFTSLKAERFLSSHKAASSLLSIHSTPLKSSWTLEKASIGNPPFSSPFKIVVGALGGEMLSISPNRT